MGIPKFFRYISERYPCLSEKLKDYQIPQFDNLYLDVNGIIHGCSHLDETDVTFCITEEEIFKNIFHYIEILFRMIQPQKLFFMAIDGVAPRAKINHQRSRRFRYGKEVEMQQANAEAKGIHIPKKSRFDSNCITPGTLFMSKLNEQLNYFVTYKISTDKLWQKCKVIFSGSQVAGEGEHKIMDYIRYMKSQPDYDPHTKHCLYGLDADLIILGLCTHEVYFTLLREEVKFGKRQTKLLTPEETKFCLFHLSLLREYIEHEFSSLKEKLPFLFDIEKIVDDWVLMGLLVGNDFIPHLPNLHITNGALSVLYNVYMEVLPTLDGYLNETGTLKLDRFEKFMERLSRFDMLTFNDVYADLKYFESKTGRRFTKFDRPSSDKLKDKETPPLKRTQDKEFDALLRSAAEMSLGDSDDDDDELEDDESDSETYNMEFVQHKRDYYINKLEYKNIDEDFLRSQAEGYVRAIQWNLHYYYNGCCSWSWYYPHHYAPYISDIKDFKDLKLEFDLGEPFLPFQQLLAVLPPFSKDLLPEAFRGLLTDEKSPIIDYYPLEFRTDLNGKRQEWEAVVLIPFIDEKDLLNAMEPHLSELTPEEQARNKHEPMCLFTYTYANMGVCKAPEYFPDFVSHASVQFINREDIIVPREKLVRGLCPGVRLDMYCPGFPTLKYIEHTTSLEKNTVKVFERVTWRDSMILHVKPPPATDLTTVASELLGKLVFVKWPYLTEAQVVGVSNCDTKLSLINPQMNYCYKNINEEELKGPLAAQWNLQKKYIIETYKVSLGVDVGETNILIHARPLIGSKYIFGNSGKLYFEKQWSDEQIAYAYQVIVKDITAHCVEVMIYKTVDDIFVPETVCFMLGHPHYGAMGKVAAPVMCKKSGRIRVSLSVTQEPCLESLKHIYQRQQTQYMPGSIAAQQLGISSYLLSKITGTIYVKSSDEFSPEETKYNVGLNLKFNKKNEEVLGYTRKENGHWLYSSKAVNLIHSYMAKCPTFFERLMLNVSNDIFLDKNLFSNGSEELDDVVAWLKNELQGLQVCPCGTESFDSDMVKQVEECIDQFLSMQSDAVKLISMQVKPHLLYKPGLHPRNVSPDPKAQTYLLDRICCSKENFTVPLGYKGTVIGIHKAENPLETMYEVLFDKTFPGGLVINKCTEFRAYRLSSIDFINISHGERVQHGTALSVVGNTESIEAWRASSNQKAQCCANASAFASYKKKIHTELPKLRIIQRNNELDQSFRLAPPPNAYKWKQCNMQYKVDAQEVCKYTKNIQQNATSDNAQKKPATKPSLEFQALWNELHKLQTPNNQPKAEVQAPMVPQAKQIDKGFPESSPQDPSAFLKAVLKISDENTGQSKQSAPNPSPSNRVPQENKALDTPPLVQQLFDHARQNDKVKDEKSPTWYCTQLLNYCLLKGVGMPRYTYFTDEKTNLVCSHILLPDKRVFVGDSCPNHEQAAGSAAEKVYTELNLVNVLSNMSTVVPPLLWYLGGQNNSWLPNVLPPGVPPQPTKPQPHQHYLQWSMQVQHNPGYQQVPPQNNQYNRQPSSIQTATKPEIKNSTTFVPLQAQKKSRNITAEQTSTKEGKECAKDNPKAVAQQKKKELPAKKVETVAATTEKQRFVESNHRQVQKTQKVPEPKKSRVAAKFGIQSQIEETNHSKKPA